MVMGKSAAAHVMLFVWLFLSIAQVSVEAGAVLELAVHHYNPNLIRNYSEWINVLLESRNQANGLVSRLSAASDSTYKRQLSSVAVESGNAAGTSFIVNVGFGTPAKYNIPMVFDTSQDVSWIKCDYRNTSSTYKKLDCSSCYTGLEGDGVSCSGTECILQTQTNGGSVLTAEVSHDTLWLGSHSLPNFGFGCGIDFSQYQGDSSVGLLAFGRGKLSLPSQAQSNSFSYCLPNYLDPEAKGKLSLGNDVSIPSNSKFTPLLSSPIATAWYFVGIQGITVGKTTLDVPPSAFQLTSTGGGTILATGIVISQLVQPAYDALTAAFVKQFTQAPLVNNSQVPLDTCFEYRGDVSLLKPPSITYHLQGGLDLPISKDGILTSVSDTNICLAFQTSSGNDLSIIGSLQQQYFTVSVDQNAKKVGFAPSKICPS